MLLEQHHQSLATTATDDFRMYSNTQRDERRPHEPRLTRFGCGDGSRIGWRQRHVVLVFFFLSVLWLSSLRRVRSCGGHHGLGSRLGLHGLFVFRFLRLRID